MAFKIEGRILRGLGGLYEIGGSDGNTYLCRAKGSLKRDENRAVVGDKVTLRVGDGEGDLVIESIMPRKNSLIRPLMANLDLVFLTVAAASPAPSTVTIDKMTAILTHNGIDCVICVTKSDLAPETAKELASVYTKAGFPVFTLSSVSGDGVDAFRAYIEKRLVNGCIAAFAGASGIGKSTLMNRLFPDLSLLTGEVSEKTLRGKHTTRAVELFPLLDGYLADTPGFSMLDFTRFDFMALEELPLAFPEFRSRLGSCRYTDCTHTKEAECGITEAVRNGEIPESRHKSFLALYEELKKKNPYA